MGHLIDFLSDASSALLLLFQLDINDLYNKLVVFQLTETDLIWLCAIIGKVQGCKCFLTLHSSGFMAYNRATVHFLQLTHFGWLFGFVPRLSPWFLCKHFFFIIIIMPRLAFWLKVKKKFSQVRFFSHFS